MIIGWKMGIKYLIFSLRLPVVEFYGTINDWSKDIWYIFNNRKLTFNDALNSNLAYIHSSYNINIKTQKLYVIPSEKNKNRKIENEENY